MAFDPDYNRLVACQASLREHMELIGVYRATLKGILGLAKIEAGAGSITWAKSALLISDILDMEIIKVKL